MGRNETRGGRMAAIGLVKFEAAPNPQLGSAIRPWTTAAEGPSLPACDGSR